MDRSSMARLLGVALAFTLALVGCGPTPPTPPGSGAGSAAKGIAFAGPLTGDNAQFGNMSKSGMMMAIEELNAAGGLHGSKIEGFYEDDAASPREAASVAQKLAGNPNVFAVVAHFNSSCSLAGRPIYHEKKVLQISPASTNVDVCKDSTWTCRNIYHDGFQGVALATYVKQALGLNKVAVFHDNDDYGIGLKDSFIGQAKKEGLEVVFEQAYQRETSDYRPHLAKFAELKPEIIMVAGLYSQAALIARQARELGIRVPLIGGDGILSEDYVKIGGSAADDTYISCPFIFDTTQQSKSTEFFHKFKARFNTEPDCWAALAYDAVMIIADGVRRGGWDRQKIRDAVFAIDSKEKALDTVTGPTYFTKNGDVMKPIHMAVIKGGKILRAEKQIQ